MISSEDFNLLQDQLISLKKEKYDANEKEKKLQNEIKLLKEQVEEATNGDGASGKAKKATSLFSDIVSRKGKMNEIQDENLELKKMIQQNTIIHQEQSEALKHNIKSLFETNSQLEDQILLLKKDLNTYIIKGEDQQSTVRKLQVDLAELHCTNEELELKIKDHTSDINSELSDINSITSGNGGNSSNIPLESIIQLFDSIENNELIKEKITELYNNNIATSSCTPPISQSSNPTSPIIPREIMFHPLGEPDYNPDTEKEKQKLRDTIKGLMEQIRENEGKSNKTVGEIKELQSGNEQLQCQVKEWQDKHRAAEINRVKIEERLENELKKYRDDLVNSNKEKQILIQENQNIHSALETSSKKFEKSIESVDETLHFEREKYEKLLIDKDMEIKELHDKSDIFKLSRDEYLSSFNNSIDEIKIKDQVIASKSIEIDTLNHRIREFEGMLQDEKKNSQQLSGALEKQSVDHSDQSAKLKQLQDKLSLERSSFDSLTEQFNKITLDHSTTEKQFKEISKLYNGSSSEIQKLQDQNDQLTQKVQDQSNTIDDLNSTCSERQMIIENQQFEIKEKSDICLQFDKQTLEMDIIRSNLLDKSNQLQDTLDKLCKLEPLYEKLKIDYDAACIRITNLEVSLVDAETEKKISEKKNVKMIKDLKMELSQSRDQLSLSSSSIGSSNGGNAGSSPSSGQNTPMSTSSSMSSLQRSAGSISLPSTPIVTPIQSRHQRAASRDFQLSSPTANNSNFAFNSNSGSNSIVNSPIKQQQQQQHHNNSNNDIQLRNDFEVMGRKLGELGSEKYILEERNRSLELNNQHLLQELEKKSSVVKFYISKTQLGRATTEDEKAKKLKGGATGSFWRNNSSNPKIAGEMVEKMEIILQENILKNMQLTKDIEFFTHESGKLKSEIQIYKSILQENKIDPSPTTNFKNIHNNLNPNNSNSTDDSNASKSSIEISSIGGSSNNDNY